MGEHHERGRHPIRTYLIGLVATILVLILAGAGFVVVKVMLEDEEVQREQRALDPFYEPPDGWRDAAPGAVLRTEPVGGVPAGGVGWRILYRTERADGSPALSGGLVFAPGGGGAPPAGGRFIVAWAHPTVGMGDQCAPSRTSDVESDVPGLAQFLEAGWVVTATDYAGLGTPGVEQYLVSGAEARDVVNSLRAARAIRETGAGARVALWGHSQGGHAVLAATAGWAEFAPDLELIATAAAAPAAELEILVSHQWDSLAGSLIGSEVLVSWPATYDGLDVDAVHDHQGGSFRALANRCIESGVLDLVIRNTFGRAHVFRRDPMRVPGWREAAVANTPASPPPSTPTLIAQGLDDPVVLPGSTAAYVEHACSAGSDLTALWLGDLGHMKAGFTAAPAVFTWLQQRVAGVPTPGTCGTIAPIAALE